MLLALFLSFAWKSNSKQGFEYASSVHSRLFHRRPNLLSELLLNLFRATIELLDQHRGRHVQIWRRELHRILILKLTTSLPVAFGKRSEREQSLEALHHRESVEAIDCLDHARKNALFQHASISTRVDRCQYQFHQRGNPSMTFVVDPSYLARPFVSQRNTHLATALIVELVANVEANDVRPLAVARFQRHFLSIARHPHFFMSRIQIEGIQKRRNVHPIGIEHAKLKVNRTHAPLPSVCFLGNRPSVLVIAINTRSVSTIVFIFARSVWPNDIFENSSEQKSKKKEKKKKKKRKRK